MRSVGVHGETIEHVRADRTLRRAREALISTSGTRPSFDHDMLRHYAMNRIRAGVALPFLTLITSLLIWYFQKDNFIVNWFAIAILLQVGILYANYYFLNQINDFKNSNKWQFYFELLEISHGIVWSLLFFYLNYNSKLQIVLICFVSSFMYIAIISMFCASIKRVALWATLLPSMTLFYVFVSSGDITKQLVGFLVLLIQLYFLFLSRQLFATTYDTLQVRAEKDDLIYELGQSKLNSDEARRRAEESSLAKSRFLASMSHELRTPLNAIIGFSEVMKTEIFGPIENKNYKEYVADIYNSGEHLLKLINEILDLSRIEAGHFDLTEEAVFLDELAAECCAMLKMRANTKSIEITTLFQSDLPPLWADERAVRQIILNIMTNAIKFTPTGGKVSVKIGWTSRGGQYVSIKDTGHGIPEDEISIVLSNFGRGTMAHKSAEEGTGLGLPIVQGLIELHGGTFSLKSKIREGTEVTCTFPETRVLEQMPQLREQKRKNN